MRYNPGMRLIHSRVGRQVGVVPRGALPGGSLPPPPGSGLVDLPAVTPSAAMPTVTGTTYTVTGSGTGSNLQTLVNAASYGDEIVIPAGVTCKLSLNLPQKSGWSPGQYITIRTSGVAGLPDIGVTGLWTPGTSQKRVNPVTHAGALAIIESPAVGNQRALKCALGARGYAFRGIKFQQDPGISAVNYGHIWMGETLTGSASTSDIPGYFLFQQCVIDEEGHTRNAMNMQCNHYAVVNCWLNSSLPGDGEAKGITTYNAQGPILVDNSYVAANGENMFIGGVDSVIPFIIPSDITVRHNWFHKPSRWNSNAPDYGGVSHLMKNSWECKTGIRQLHEGNIYDGCKGGGQTGEGLVLKTANQNGGMEWAESGHITVRRNLQRNTGAGMAFLAEQKNGATPPENYEGAIKMHDLHLHDNLILTDPTGVWSGAHRTVQITSNYQSDTTDLNWTFEHNTFMGPQQHFISVEATQYGLHMKNNVWGYPLEPGVVSTAYGIFGTGAGQGDDCLNIRFPDCEFVGNVLTSMPASHINGFPGNYTPATNAAAGVLDTGEPVAAGALYPGGACEATDGLVNGCDYAALQAEINGVDS